MQNLSTFSSQRGASVTSVVLFLIALGLLAKLGLGIIPAYVGDYQFTQLVAKELKKANDAKQDERTFLNNLDQQLNINANYDVSAKERLVIINKTPGALSVKSKYEVENRFYGQTYIVNRFEKNIDPAKE